MSRFKQLFLVDETLAEGDLFDAGDLEALPGFDGLNEVGRLNQRIVGAGIKPGKTAAKTLHRKLTPLQVFLVDNR